MCTITTPGARDVAGACCAGAAGGASGGRHIGRGGLCEVTRRHASEREET